MTTRRILISTLLVALGATAAGAADWPCFLGANRDNTSADTNLKLWSGDSPKVSWKKNVGTGHSCMAVVGKQLFTQGDGAVWCLDSETGNVVWRYPATGSGKGGETMATPAVANGSVFALNNNHTIVCLDTAKGELQWSARVESFGVKQGIWPLSCSPLVLGDQVIMDLGVVVVLDRKTGKLVWKAGSGMAGYASAVVFGQTGQERVTSFTGAGLAIYSLSDGKLVAKYKWEMNPGVDGVSVATPIVSAGRIFISSGYDRGCALLSLDGDAFNKVWENKEMNNHCQNCAIAGGFIYGIDGQEGQRATLKCLDLKTGKLKWGEKGLPLGGGLTLADGKLFQMLDNGTLLVTAASPSAFHELARAKVLDGQCWTMPMVANGRVYCRSHAGDLVCLDLR